MTPEQMHSLIRDVPDFPESGIVFKDLTPLLGDAAGLRAVVDALVAPVDGDAIDLIVGIEARGFVLAAPMADRLGAGLVLARKAGKLPSEVRSATYDLEYGTATLQIHADAIPEGARVLVVDDVLATGGTAAATVGLVREARAELVGCAFLMELTFLDGRSRLPDLDVTSVLTV